MHPGVDFVAYVLLAGSFNQPDYLYQPPFRRLDFLLQSVVVGGWLVGEKSNPELA